LRIQIIDQRQQFPRRLPFDLARQAAAAGEKIMQLRQTQAVRLERLAEWPALAASSGRVIRRGGNR
jgi:hypothetical protein